MPRLTEIAPGVLVATAAYATTTSTVVAAADGGCLVIDPAVSVADLSALAAGLAAAGLRPRAGFATHPHWDHVLWSRELGRVPRYAAPAALTVTSSMREEMIAAVEDSAPGHDLALFADLVALAVIASFATTIQSQIVDGSRIMFGMGRDRTVPKALGRVNPRFRTPVAGLIVMGVIPVLALVLYLASDSLQKTIIYIDSTGGLLFAGYYVVISLYSIWYYRTVLFRDLREFVLGLLLPLVGAATLVYVIVKSLPGTPVPVRIIALVLFLVGIPLAFLSKAIIRAPFFATRREHYQEDRPEPARV